MRSESKNIFEISKPGRRAVAWPKDETLASVDITARVPDSLRRSAPAELPEAAEIDVVRHYTKLSKRNFGVDDGFYPLGSCTMKYNPRLNEKAAAMTRFQALHPQADEELVQGNLRIMYELQEQLKAITGFDAFSLQPSAGAHGEFASLLVMRRYLDANGGKDRRTIILPDSSHGTNPASCVVAGFTPKNIGHNDRGLVDIDELKAAVGPDTAGIMLTNPNTLGLFEEDIVEIAKIVHDAGGLLYMDGANLNAIMGIARPAEMGFDVMHINLHKTFSTPHGGGGPGSGPIGVTEALAPYLPKPVAAKDGARYFLDYDRPDSIGKVKGFYGNFGIMLRAWTYIRFHGADGLRKVSENAVLNANYLMHKLKDRFELPYDRTCMHEFVLSADRQKDRGAKALDIAKRLLDYGFHPPTVYFPLIVHEAMMIEPTETENRETLDSFAEAMLAIDAEIDVNLEEVTTAPHNTCVNRLDEAGAARKPIVKWDDAE